MTITIGAWLLPALITGLGWIPMARHRDGDYGVGGAFLFIAWAVASVIAWAVYAFTLLAGEAMHELLIGFALIVTFMLLAWLMEKEDD